MKDFDKFSRHEILVIKFIFKKAKKEENLIQNIYTLIGDDNLKTNRFPIFVFVAERKKEKQIVLEIFKIS